MNIYEGNDLRDALRYWDHRVNKAGVRDDDPPAAGRSGMVMRRSYVLNLGRAAWLEWIEPALRSLSEVETDTKKGLDAIDKKSLDFRYVLKLTGGDVLMNQENADRDEPAFALVLDQGMIELAIIDEALDAFAQLASDHCFFPVLSYSPSAYTAYSAYAEFQDPSLEPALTRFSNRLRAYLRDAAERFGLEFYDLTDDLRAEIDSREDSQDGHLLYLPHNVHFSAEGHGAVAAALAKFIEVDLSDRLAPSSGS